MKNDTIIRLTPLEIDILINILDEIVTSHKIPDVITEEIRQELFAELNIAKILTELKEKLGRKKFTQLEDQDTEQLHFVELTDTEIYNLRARDYGDAEIVISQILEQIDKQKEKE